MALPVMKFQEQGYKIRVEKTPISIFSTFGSKINEFERKKSEKTKKFQKPKSCRQLP